MSPLDEARAHLAQAREFLQAAEWNLELELFNAATSNAVISGINSKDAACLTLTGYTRKSDSHATAVTELRAAGAESGPHADTTKRMATDLGRLLRLKGKAQYQTAAVARSDAQHAVSWAQRLLDDSSMLTR